VKLGHQFFFAKSAKKSADADSNMPEPVAGEFFYKGISSAYPDGGYLELLIDEIRGIISKLKNLVIENTSQEDQEDIDELSEVRSLRMRIVHLLPVRTVPARCDDG